LFCNVDIARWPPAGFRCGLDARSSFCWMADGGGDSSAACGNGAAGRLANCVNTRNNAPTCPDAVNAASTGSVKCCADDFIAEGPGFRDQEDQCGQYKCGKTCGGVDGCGWSTPKKACVPGSKTNKKEWSMGECSDAELRGPTDAPDPCAQVMPTREPQHTLAQRPDVLTASQPVGCWRLLSGVGCRRLPRQLLTMTSDRALHVCAQFTCGITCAQAASGQCGWNSPQGVCQTGHKTSKAEYYLGTECPEDDSKTQQAREESEARAFCSKLNCG